MDTVTTCPCCQSAELRYYPAVVAPFIASYVLGVRPRRTRLAECVACTFRFFEERYAPDEVARLYAGYRGERYFRERHRFERWYTRGTNDAIGSDARAVQVRRARVARLVEAHAAVPLGSVLDYGGDRGQFIPAGLAARRWVFEISGTTPAPGVTAVSSEAELAGRAFDLVMLAHVLEHATAPDALLRTVRQLVAPGGLLYLEVPAERYRMGCVPSAGRPGAGLYVRYLDALLAVPPALAVVDFVSTVLRVKAHVVPPLGFVKLHEHVNFFNAASVRALLARTGFALLGDATAAPTGVAGDPGAFAWLARAVGSPQPP